LRWLDHRYGVEPNRTVSSAAYIWLDQAPEPKEYPATPSDLRKFVQSHAPDGLRIVDELLGGVSGKPVVILATSKGFGAYRLEAAPSTSQSKTTAASMRGFRPGRVPPVLSASRARGQRL